MTQPLVTFAPHVDCPAWCAQPAGHHLDLYGGVARRWHLSGRVTVLGSGDVQVQQFETVTAAGMVTRDPVEVLVGGRRWQLSELLTVHDLAVAVTGPVGAGAA